MCSRIRKSNKLRGGGCCNSNSYHVGYKTNMKQANQQDSPKKNSQNQKGKSKVVIRNK